MTRKIGGYIALPIGAGLLAWVDLYAAEYQVSRAHAVRAIVGQFAVDYGRAHGATIDGPDPVYQWRPIGGAAGSVDATGPRMAVIPEVIG